MQWNIFDEERYIVTIRLFQIIRQGSGANLVYKTTGKINLQLAGSIQKKQKNTNHKQVLSTKTKTCEIILRV